jgi:hypothetical protein
MPPSVERAAAKVAYSPMVTAALRVIQFITPLIISAILWVGGNYLAGQASAMAAVLARVSAVEQFDTSSDKRLTSLETAATIGRADRLAFQDRTDAALNKIADAQSQLLAAVAALTARLDANDRAAARP